MSAYAYAYALVKTSFEELTLSFMTLLLGSKLECGQHIEVVACTSAW